MQYLFCFPRKLFHYFMGFFNIAKLGVLPKSSSSYCVTVFILLHFCSDFLESSE